jgi:hypothetical protein
MRSVEIVDTMNQVREDTASRGSPRVRAMAVHVFVPWQFTCSCYEIQLYQEFNISIALVGVVTWTERDLISMPDDMDPVPILVNFKDYYYHIPGNMDSALLIS